MQDMEEDNESSERDTELENIFGRLFVADYVVDRLLLRMDDKFASAYNRNKNARRSTFVFVQNGMQYKVSLEIRHGPTREEDEDKRDNGKDDERVWTELIFGQD